MITKKQTISLAIICSILSISSFGAAFALYESRPADINIGLEAFIPQARTITYHLPSGDGSTFNTATVQATDGSSLYTALSSYTGAVGNYTFMNKWHTSHDHFWTNDENNDALASDTTISNDIEVWAKYAEVNVAYYCDDNTTNHTYLHESAEVSINASTFQYGNHVYGTTGIENNEHIINLQKSSGRYHLYKVNASTWNVSRVIAVSVENVANWWFDASAKTFIYYYKTNLNLTYWSESLTFTDNVAKFEIPQDRLDYYNFIVVRAPSDKTEGTFDDEYNQGIDLKVTDLNDAPTGETIIFNPFSLSA